MTAANVAERKSGRRVWLIALIVVAVLTAGGSWFWHKEGRAWLYGVEAYVYGFPLMMMDLTKKQATAVPTAGEFTAPVNQFSVMAKYPDASFRAVPRTGLDTLFAVAWADLDQEPLVLSVPDTGGRYYVIALFDMWSNVFASIGSRTTGTGAQSFMIVGPRWQGTPPADVKELYRSPTRFVWVNGQMLCNGPAEYDAVNALQKQYKLTPLSAWGQPYEWPVRQAPEKRLRAHLLYLRRWRRLGVHADGDRHAPGRFQRAPIQVEPSVSPSSCSDRPDCGCIGRSKALPGLPISRQFVCGQMCPGRKDSYSAGNDMGHFLGCQSQVTSGRCVVARAAAGR